MNFYIQKTGKKYRPELKHPIGKYVLSFMWYGKDRTGFLLSKKDDESWLSSGFPMFGREYTDPKDGLTKRSQDDSPWYFDDKDEALKRLNSMGGDWREAYSVYKVTGKGFRLIKSGEQDA